jgi:hypothetical protein
VVSVTDLYGRIIGFLDNISIKILDIFIFLFFYLKHGFSDIGICLRLQVEPTQLDAINRERSRIAIFIFIYYRHKLRELICLVKF